MSGVYIQGMEMPENCWLCPLSTFYDKPREMLRCKVTKEEVIRSKIDSSCPLVPVPPHGRLGDLDKLESNLRNMAKYQSGYRQQGILGCCETIRLAPTIIPASEEGEI